MSLAEELRKRLYDENEPVSKRLKIGQNALLSSECLIQKKEDIVIKWLAELLVKNQDFQVAKVLEDCLQSTHMRRVNSSDISDETRIFLLTTLAGQLDIELAMDISESELNSLNHICQNPSFQSFLKKHKNIYAKIVSTYLKRVKNIQQVEKILHCLTTYSKEVSGNDNFKVLFISELLYPVGMACSRVENSSAVINALEQILFTTKTRINIKKSLTAMFDNNDDPTFKCDPVLQTMLDEFSTEFAYPDLPIVSHNFYLLFSGFVRSCHGDQVPIIQLFLITARILGFKITDNNFKCIQTHKFTPEKSLILLDAIFQCLREKYVIFSAEFNNLTFQKYMGTIITKVLKLSKTPSGELFQLLSTTIAINPNVIEENLNEILSFSMEQRKVNQHRVYYHKFMVSLIFMYSKLHREHKLMSIILKSLNNFLGPGEYFETRLEKSRIVMNDILPPSLFLYFIDMIRPLSSKQSIVVLRTFVFHINNDIIDVMDTKNCGKSLILLVSVHGELLVIFLKAVAMIDDNIPKAALNRFLNSMDDMKKSLSRLGQKLLNMVHQCDVMYSFLQICLAWAELFLHLLKTSSYNIDEKEKYISMDPEKNTYLFDYLTEDQWKTFDQRIANFGEVRCKVLMRKLTAQRRRIATLCDNNAVTTSATDDSRMVACEVLDRILGCYVMEEVQDDVEKIAEFLINHVVVDGRFGVLNHQLIQENRSMLKALIFLSMAKVSKELKLKRHRKQDPSQITLLSKKVLRYIEQKILVHLVTTEEYTDAVSAMVQFFEEPIPEQAGFILNEDNVVNYIKILNCLPLAFCSEAIQLTVMLVVMAIHSDYKKFGRNSAVLEPCEEIVLDIFQRNRQLTISNFMNFSTLLQIGLTYIKYKEFIPMLVGVYLKTDSFADQIILNSKNIETLVNPSQYLFVLTTIFEGLSKRKKTNLEDETVRQINRTTYKLASKVLEDIHAAKYSLSDLMAAYSLAIKRCFLNDRKNLLPGLLRHLSNFLDFAFMNIKKPSELDKCAELINVCLKNMDKLHTYLPEDFLIQCGFATKHSDTIKLSIILETAPHEDFLLVVAHCASELRESLKLGDCKIVKSNMNAINIILSCSVNEEKCRTRQQTVKEIMEEMMLYMATYSHQRVVIVLEFFIKLIQARQIQLTSGMIDTILMILLYIKFPFEQNSTATITFCSIFSTVIDVMEALISFRGVLVLDKIHSALHVYRHLLSNLCRKSDVNASYNCEQQITNCAHRFQKLNINLTKHKKDLVRLAPYLIMDILHSYEKTTFYMTIKTYLNNCVHALISICDSHAHAYLLRILSPASQQMYKQIYDEFNKFHRYTGRS